MIKYVFNPLSGSFDAVNVDSLSISGTVNYVPKFTSANTIGDSSIADSPASNPNSVVISKDLDVDGDLTFGDNTGVATITGPGGPVFVYDGPGYYERVGTSVRTDLSSPAKTRLGPGVDVLYVVNTGPLGRVGVLTSSPSYELDVNGVIGAIGGTSIDWNLAYSWGNHASASYATQSYVGTAIANLVDSSPTTLDTLNELAAALGDDPNFATTVSTALGNRLRVDLTDQGLTALQKANGRTSLGATTVGSNLFTAANPSAVTFLRINSDNSVSTLNASDFRTAIGAGTGTLTAESDTLATVTGRGATTTLAITTGGVTTTGSITAAAALAMGAYFNNTLVASANNDVLVGVDINPTFTNGSFTGVLNTALRVNGSITPLISGSGSIGTGSLPFNNGVFSGVVYGSTFQGYSSGFNFNVGGVNFGRFHTTTGNLTLQNGGTFTDAGYRLDVNGTARVTGMLTLASSNFRVSPNEFIGSVALPSTLDGTNNTAYINIGTFTSAFNHIVVEVELVPWLLNTTNIGSYSKTYVIRLTSASPGVVSLYGANVTRDIGSVGEKYQLGTPIANASNLLQIPVHYIGSGSGNSVTARVRVTGNIVGNIDSVSLSTTTPAAVVGGTQEYVTFRNRVGIGAASPTAALQVGTSITAASAIARGAFFNNTLVAAANNDVLAAVDINPTFTNGAFTGVANFALRTVTGNVVLNSTSGNTLIGTSTDSGYKLDVNGISRFTGTALINPQLNITAGTVSTQLRSTSFTLQIRTNDASVLSTEFFQNGNVAIGGGSDNGYKLDVNGTARIQNQLTTTGTITAASAIARGAYFNQTLTAAANNDVLAAVDIDTTFTNGSFTGVGNWLFRARNSGTTRSQIGRLGQQEWYLSNGTVEIGKIAYGAPGGFPGITLWTGAAYNQNRFNLINNGAFFGLAFDADGPTESLGQLNIFPLGNVGIGTQTDFGYRLDVIGTIRAYDITTSLGLSSYEWDIAYNERAYWDGGSTGLDAAIGRASLGVTGYELYGSDGSYGGAQIRLGDIYDLTYMSVELIGSGATTVSWSAGGFISISSTNTTYSAGSGITLSGNTFSHTDTSSQATVTNTGGSVIQSITLDTYGHITTLASLDLDSRYSLTTHDHSGQYVETINETVVDDTFIIRPQGVGAGFLGTASNYFFETHTQKLFTYGIYENGLRTENIGNRATGTVVVWKDGKLSPCSTSNDHMVMGVIDHGNDSPIVMGAEPVLVTGQVNEGDYLVTSEKLGHAKAMSREELILNNLMDTAFAKALESGNGDSYTVKAMINKL